MIDFDVSKVELLYGGCYKADVSKVYINNSGTPTNFFIIFKLRNGKDNLPQPYKDNPLLLVEEKNYRIAGNHIVVEKSIENIKYTKVFTLLSNDLSNIIKDYRNNFNIDDLETVERMVHSIIYCVQQGGLI